MKTVMDVTANETSTPFLWLRNTVKPFLSGHSIVDKVFKTNASCMKVLNIAECSLGAFCNMFDLH